MDIVKAENLKYEYVQVDEEGNEEARSIAVDGVNLQVKAGDFVAILGHNGSGKSTLAKHINAILLPTEGTLYVDGKDTKDESKLWEIRQTAGMVFQNPDNQIIGTIVEEDVGFGPENMGVPQAEIWKRVEKSLKSVGMWEYRDHSPNKLSGGQKQLGKGGMGAVVLPFGKGGFAVTKHPHLPLLPRCVFDHNLPLFTSGGFVHCYSHTSMNRALLGIKRGILPGKFRGVSSLVPINRRTGDRKQDVVGFDHGKKAQRTAQ